MWNAAGNSSVGLLSLLGVGGGMPISIEQC